MASDSDDDYYRRLPFEIEGRIILREGDSLEDLPERRQRLLTPEIRAAFADPVACFRDVADRAPLASFAAWLRALTTGKWQLVLIAGEGGSDYGFRWQAPGAVEGTYPLGAYRDDGPLDHPDFRLVFSVVGGVGRERPGLGRRLFPPDRCPTVEEFGFGGSRSPRFPAETTKVFGDAGCGDMLVFTAAGDAGILSHETGEVEPMGTLREMRDRMFRTGLLKREW